MISYVDFRCTYEIQMYIQNSDVHTKVQMYIRDPYVCFRCTYKSSNVHTKFRCTDARLKVQMCIRSSYVHIYEIQMNIRLDAAQYIASQATLQIQR